MGPLCIFSTVEVATSNLVHNLGLGLAYQKRRLRPKLAGVWARKAQKNWDPIRISATVEASNSNLVHKFALGLDYQKRCLGPKFAGLLARVHPKKLGPLLISATVETSNFKFGIQLGFGTILPKNNV